MGSKFKMNSSATKQAAKRANEEGKKLKRFRMDENRVSAELLILGPISDDCPALFTTKKHEIWSQGRPISVVGTPSVDKNGEATGEKDPIMELGWKIREKYQDSENEKKQTFWQRFMPNTQHHVVVLDLKNIDAGPMLFTMPKSVADMVIDEFNENKEDLTPVCDFDEGRVLYIKHNGEKGKKRKYKVVKFKDEAKLLEDGTLTKDDIEDIAEKMPDLRRLQPEYNKKAYDEHFEKLKKSAQSLGIDLDAIEAGEEVEDNDEYEVDEGEEGSGGDEEVVVDESEDIVVDDDEGSNEEEESGESESEEKVAEEEESEGEGSEEEEEKEEKSKRRSSRRSKSSSSKNSESSSGSKRRRGRRRK